ncbi:MAG: acyl-CoA thioesterase II [Pseudomonadota bacterium]
MGARAVRELCAILDLERLEENLFRGTSPQTGWQRVYGGQVIGQALVAAARTVNDRPVHSLHGYFLLGGDPSVPIIYEVDRIRDGKSFTTRRVVAIQHGRAIFSMSASFQKTEPGLEHQADLPDGIPSPEDLPSEEQMKALFIDKVPKPVRAYWERERPIEWRPVNLNRYMNRDPLDPLQHVWFKASDRLPDDPGLHACTLAYASDMTLLDTSLLAHGRTIFDSDLQVASLDHAMWFHRPFRADEWLLYAQDSPNASSARGFNRGMIFDVAGNLVASTAQEGLIRKRELNAGRSESLRT